MKTSRIVVGGAVVTAVYLLTGCATWHGMDTSEKGTAVGATGGAIVGAAVGGPVGAAVGAGVGDYAGHYEGPEVADRTNDNATSGSGARVSANNTADASKNTGNNPSSVGMTHATNRGSNEEANQSTEGVEANGSTIRAAQEALNDKGYNAGAVDGLWGPHTRSAVLDFQQAQGIAQSGELDQQTLSALGVSQ